jgi:hypothetical protein
VTGSAGLQADIAQCAQNAVGDILGARLRLQASRKGLLDL